MARIKSAFTPHLLKSSFSKQSIGSIIALKTKKSSSLWKKGRGFTLIELLVVVAIIGLIASIVLVNLTGNTDKAKLARAKQFHGQVTHALQHEAVGIWRFEEGGGDTAGDASGYGNQGNLAGTGVCPGAAACPTWQTETACGLGFGGCLSFDETGDYVVNQTYRLDWATSTTGFWYKHESGSIGTILAHNRNGDTIPGLWFIVESNNVYMRMIKAGAIIEGVGGGYQVSPGRWYYFTGTSQQISGGSTYRIRFYADGVLRGESVEVPYHTNTQVGNAILSIGSQYNWFGGANNPHDFAKGMIDEVYAFSQPLTTAQIQQLYAQGLQRHLIAKAGTVPAAEQLHAEGLGRPR